GGSGPGRDGGVVDVVSQTAEHTSGRGMVAALIRGGDRIDRTGPALFLEPGCMAGFCRSGCRSGLLLAQTAPLGRAARAVAGGIVPAVVAEWFAAGCRSEEHTSELQS